jgi:formylglycine-generating enzyme required for sulfatase activity
LTKGFWIAQTPITQQHWIEITHSTLPLFDHTAAGRALPAEGMQWDTARAYCRQLTVMLRREGVLAENQIIDLPTEAQWEFACRAGTTSRWHFGNNRAELGEYAWYAENSGAKKHRVGLKSPNPWGIYDLYGNVAEWCQDDLFKYQDSEEADPCHVKETGLVKVTRGGDFSCPAVECRSASRGSCNRDNPFNEATGLRIICCERGSETQGTP